MQVPSGAQLVPAVHGVPFTQGTQAQVPEQSVSQQWHRWSPPQRAYPPPSQCRSPKPWQSELLVQVPSPEEDEGATHFSPEHTWPGSQQSSAQLSLPVGQPQAPAASWHAAPGRQHESDAAVVPSVRGKLHCTG
jgi:hypothetical protein